MRISTCLLACSVSAVLLATPAFASTDYFYLTDNTTNTEYTFTLPSSPTPNPSLASVFGDPITYQSGSTSGSGTAYFYTTGLDGGLQLVSAANVALAVTDGAQVFSGTTSAPTFILGTYAETQALGSDSYTLVIADQPLAATPEPSSIALLATGLLGAAGAIRRRLAR